MTRVCFLIFKFLVSLTLFISFAVGFREFSAVEKRDNRGGGESSLRPARDSSFRVDCCKSQFAVKNGVCRNSSFLVGKDVFGSFLPLSDLNAPIFFHDFFPLVSSPFFFHSHFTDPSFFIHISPLRFSVALFVGGLFLLIILVPSFFFLVFLRGRLGVLFFSCSFVGLGRLFSRIPSFSYYSLWVWASFFFSHLPFCGSGSSGLFPLLFSPFLLWPAALNCPLSGAFQFSPRATPGPLAQKSFLSEETHQRWLFVAAA